MGINQLGHILVAGGNNNLQALLTGLLSQGAYNIICLHPWLADIGQAHRFYNLVDRLYLLAQFIRHGRTIGLVLRVHVVPECFPFGIEDHRYRAVGIILVQPPEHVNHTLDRPGCLAFGGNQGWQGVKCPIDVGRAVNQYDGGSFICGHAVYLYCGYLSHQSRAERYVTFIFPWSRGVLKKP